MTPPTALRASTLTTYVLPGMRLESRVDLTPPPTVFCCSLLSSPQLDASETTEVEHARTTYSVTAAPFSACGAVHSTSIVVDVSESPLTVTSIGVRAAHVDQLGSCGGRLV